MRHDHDVAAQYRCQPAAYPNSGPADSISAFPASAAVRDRSDYLVDRYSERKESEAKRQAAELAKIAMSQEVE
jgi:hypothetical protein